MDEKVLGYLINNCMATKECVDGVEAAFKALFRQTKINRRQRVMNSVLFMLTVTCVSNIYDLLKAVKSQNEKIKALEAKVYGEESNNKKGA